MQPTRACLRLALVAALLAALAVLYGQPILLLGTAALGGVVLAAQVRFALALRATDAALSVDLDATRTHVSRGEEIPVTLSARLETDSPLTLRVTAEPPVVASHVRGDDLDLSLDAGDREASASATAVVDWSVVGRTAFDRPVVHTRDPLGLFEETLPRGPEPTVTVSARAPREVHVGAGGEAAVATYGGHRSDQLGPGSDPAEVRQYVPGDSVRDIDWKATARLDFPHVREYEVETDRETLLVLDSRSVLATGPRGETKLDYLREVALAIVERAAELSDPLGLAVVGEAGTRSWQDPGTTAETYRTVRESLTDLDLETDGGAAGEETASPSASAGDRPGPGTARRKSLLLAGEDSAYAERVGPFVGETESYVQQLSGDPLFETLRTRVSEVADSTWTVLLTDDSHRTEVREAVKLARSRTRRVTVYLAPTALFEPSGLADLESAYDAYVDFEDFRRELARLDGVEAYEVAPGERIEAVLAAGRARRG